MSPTPTVVGDRTSLDKTKQNGLTRFGSHQADGSGPGEQSPQQEQQEGEKEKQGADEGVQWKPAGINLLKFAFMLLLTFWIIATWFFGSEVGALTARGCSVLASG